MRPRTPREPSTLDLVVGRIGRADDGMLRERLRALLEASHGELVVCDVGALVDPDVGTVDALARLQLTAGRLGRHLRLRGASPELLDLLALVGLRDVVRCAESGVEPGRQSEDREEPPGVEEERDPADPLA
jgi:ABC-type transporter Mla MlaB component